MGIGIDRLTMFMTGETSIQDVLFFPQMRPEKKVVADPTEKYVGIGVPEEWVPAIQKMGYITVESLRKLAPGKFFNDLCGFNKKNKLGAEGPLDGGGQAVVRRRGVAHAAEHERTSNNSKKRIGQ